MSSTRHQGGGDEVRVIDIESVPDGTWQPDGVTADRNALGVRPEPILYLWNFERPDSMNVHLIDFGWVKIGPIYLLPNPEARVETPILREKKEIRRALDACPESPGRFEPPKLTDFEARRAYRGYPIHVLRCSDKVWREAFTLISRKCSRFIMDLTTRERSTGLAFELESLLGRVSVENILFLIDKGRTDLALSVELLSQAWFGSGRRSQERAPALLAYNSFKLGLLARAALSAWTGKSLVPVARRAAGFAGWGDQ